MAKLDKLTGLYSRQYFDAVFEVALKSMARRSRSQSIVLFDIDSFKHINDQYGHLAGDAVIREVAKCAQSVVRASDIICRGGGDEFMILLDNCSAANARQIVDKLRVLIRDHACRSDSGIAVSVSAGVTEYRSGDTYDSILDRADRALYAAKQNGRNQTQVAA